MGRVDVHDVAPDLDLADPRAFRRLPWLLFHGLQGYHWTAPLGHSNRITPFIHLVEQGKALGLWLVAVTTLFFILPRIDSAHLTSSGVTVD